MCGIVAYVGNKRVEPLLIEGLKRLEYRGYDSAGLAVVTSPTSGAGVMCLGRVALSRKRRRAGGMMRVGVCAFRDRWVA